MPANGNVILHRGFVDHSSRVRVNHRCYENLQRWRRITDTHEEGKHRRMNLPQKNHPRLPPPHNLLTKLLALQANKGAQRYKTSATERSYNNFPYHPASHNSTPMLPWGVPMAWFYPGMPFSHAHMPSAYPANRHSAPVQAQYTAQEILPATPPCTTVPPQHTAQGIPPVPPPSTPVQTQHTAQGILPVSHPSTPVPTQHTAKGNLSIPSPSTPVNTHNTAQGLLPVSPFRTAVPSQRPTPIHMSTPVPSVR